MTKMSLARSRRNARRGAPKRTACAAIDRGAARCAPQTKPADERRDDARQHERRAAARHA
ncbi:hypothetical protein WI23_01300 [Burkholderia oklahomensis C6786]|nr:hypothetical protein WI23_01300 [Burkholderia oklahomensis C6786]KUY54854.1 hypothetical protein WI23_20935 [Burkholderia oklahomensis C6786]